ncbi:hypothetical protein E2C01_001050 [Portunus trituberculatus]|uniref:Uncharacterized protein n=1 Tax=Portunus trituberculatus TaxID=210409 RepID=A0A5B7CLI7_PORTR|nr:hypothetical protein [Portunus trituberculatus]
MKVLKENMSGEGAQCFSVLHPLAVPRRAPARRPLTFKLCRARTPLLLMASWRISLCHVMYCVTSGKLRLHGDS